MPVIDLQRRMAQLGEIRLGHAVDTGRTSEKTGRPIKRPEKLDRFRFTSPSRPQLEAIAALYGGQVARWSPQNGDPDEWEVHTAAERLPVLVPPNAISQWYELYQGSRCVRRCDGATEQKQDVPCVCNPEKRECALTTRLNVMLRDVPGVGVWLLTTHGYYAAVELPPMAELLAHVGGYVSAWLALEEKRIVREDGKTNRFMIPKLEVDITPAQLMAGQGGIAAPALQSRAAAPALTTGTPDYLAEATAATSLEGVQAVWRRANDAGHLTDELAGLLKPLGDRFLAAQPPPLDPDALWQQIVALCPDGWTLPKLEADFAYYNDGLAPGSASGEQLAAYLQRLQQPAEAPA